MNVDLPLTNVDKKPDGCPENDRSNAGPEDCPLAHRAGLGRRVEDEIGTIKGGAVGDQPVDGVDFPVSGGVLFRSVPALGDDFTSNAVDDDRSERSLRHLGCQGDGLSHVAFVIQFDHRCTSDKDIKTIHNTSKPRMLQAAVRTQLVETKRRCTPESNAIDKRL